MDEQDRAEKTERPERAERTDARVSTDWSRDNFPTSAKKVFIGWGVMIGGVLVLCLLVYMSSEHPVDPKKAEKVSAAQSNLEAVDEDGAEEE